LWYVLPVQRTFTSNDKEDSLRAYKYTAIVTASVLVFCWEGLAQKQVIGWVEKAIVQPGNLVLHAKLDTGADNTSIDVQNISAFSRDGRKILRFQVDDREGRTVDFEKEQVGIEVVPQHSGDDEYRPLVIMEVCLGNECRETLVNLADRSRQDYPLLIGRSFMLDRVIVNPGAQYRAEPKTVNSPKSDKP
jgi:hypothetical protein